MGTVIEPISWSQELADLMAQFVKSSLRGSETDAYIWHELCVLRPPSIVLCVWRCASLLREPVSSCDSINHVTGIVEP